MPALGNHIERIRPVLKDFDFVLLALPDFLGISLQLIDDRVRHKVLDQQQSVPFERLDVLAH